MIPRILEPEVMNSPEDARDYDAMDHRSVNEAFVADFLAMLSSAKTLCDTTGLNDQVTIIDVGTGTALIPILLSQQFSGACITAVDLSREMLRLAQRNIESAKLADRITVQICDGKALPFADRIFDAVISNSIIHHLPEPIAPFREMLRVLKPGGALFVRDLLRPATTDEVERLVALYAAGETPHARKMFQDSLHAALTLYEVRQALVSAGIAPEWASQTSDRHWTVAGTIGQTLSRT